MMGSGKSSVGEALAARLGVPFVDTDREIEKGAGCRIPEIFAREGEAGFRRRERKVIESLQASGSVVALGGGAVSQPGIAGPLGARGGCVVWLRARPDTLLARLGHAPDRPLLAGLEPEARAVRLGELLAAREADYAAAASLVVDTDGRGVEETACAVRKALEAAA